MHMNSQLSITQSYLNFAFVLYGWEILPYYTIDDPCILKQTLIDFKRTSTPQISHKYAKVKSIHSHTKSN